MPDLDTQVRRYAEYLETRVPDITTDEIFGGAGRATVLPPLGSRRPLRVAAAAAAAALVLIGGIALLTRIIGPGDPPVVTTPEPPPTIQASEWPLGMIVANASGIAVVPFDSPDEPILLQSDDRYRGISWAISDHRGGLIFTHDMTPPPWAPGSVLWLRAGASTPEVLFEPEGDPIQGHDPVVGMTTSAEGHALLVYTVIDGETGPYPRPTSRIMVADLDDGGSSRQLAELDGLVHYDFGRYWVSSGGGIVAVFGDAYERDCIPVTVLSVDDGSHIPAGIDCFPQENPVVWPTVSHDGRSLAVHRGSTVTVINLASGEALDEATIGTDDRIVPSPGGWLVSSFTGSEVRLVDLDGTERGRSEWALDGQDRWNTHFYHHPLVLAQTIGLGSGSGEVPCQPTTVPLEDQDLPEPVAAARRLLFDLAASCDYEGLAALAIEHEALLFTGGCCWLPPEEDLVSFWISAGLTKPQAAGMLSREPLASLAAMLRTRPAHVDDIAHWPVYVGPSNEYADANPEPSGCVWVWPALYVGAEGDPGDGALWSEHYDYRIGIAADGTWRFFMAHFFEPGVSPVPPPCGDE